MGVSMKYFSKALLGYEIVRSMVSWATKFFKKLCQILRPLPSYILNVYSLTSSLQIWWKTLLSQPYNIRVESIIQEVLILDYKKSRKLFNLFHLPNDSSSLSFIFTDFSYQCLDLYLKIPLNKPEKHNTCIYS